MSASNGGTWAVQLPAPLDGCVGCGDHARHRSSDASFSEGQQQQHGKEDLVINCSVPGHEFLMIWHVVDNDVELREDGHSRTLMHERVNEGADYGLQLPFGDITV